MLDRLAFAGIRFNRFYATPRCSPTRAALLTGVWSHEAGVGHLDLDWGRPAYRGAIHDSVPTIAERLRERGYANYMVGKWHLSPERMETTAAESRGRAAVAGVVASPARLRRLLWDVGGIGQLLRSARGLRRQRSRRVAAGRERAPASGATAAAPISPTSSAIAPRRW